MTVRVYFPAATVLDAATFSRGTGWTLKGDRLVVQGKDGLQRTIELAIFKEWWYAEIYEADNSSGDTE